MSRHHKLLQTDEVYSSCVKMIENTLRSIQTEIMPIKKFIGARKREIIKISTKADKSEYGKFGYTRAFYDHTLQELMNIEQACQECLLRLKIDLLTATMDRMQPPSYLTTVEMVKGSEICCDTSSILNKKITKKKSDSCCRENKQRRSRGDASGVTTNIGEATRTQFDESDLKFKHEIICLRTKMFSLPRKRTDSKSGSEITSESVSVLTGAKGAFEHNAFMTFLKQKEPSYRFSAVEELSKVPCLKFSDGNFRNCDVWTKILDVYQKQIGSIWNLVLRPQIERIAKKRLIPTLHLKPRATLEFLLQIKENGVKFELTKERLCALVVKKTEIQWLRNWKLQFSMNDKGKHLAATMIQAIWRGYALRRKKEESDRIYIAASYFWFCWITQQSRKELHERYLERMLISLQTTRELSLKLSKEYNTMVQKPHVVIHLPSIGHPVDVRRTFDPKAFRAIQNVAILRICMVRNPKAEVIYVLPINPTDDLLLMYSDFIESLCPTGNAAERITFIALSQTDTFKHCSINVSRVLHCSEDSMGEIRKKIAGKAAYFLPWFIDECDMRLAGILNIPLLNPDMELQRTMLNLSTMTKMIENLGLLQPIHARDIKDYKTLCSTLAEFIALHTEVCVWLIRLNYGVLNKHFGIFLINHISVPFMPLLRKEREKHGEIWKEYPSLRAEYLQQLNEHLPNVVSDVTRLSKLFRSWKEFYIHIQKYGCLLQAVPAERNAKTISVTLFVYGRGSNKQPRWIGTADKLNLETEVISTFMYMIPQSSLDIKQVESSVNKFTMAMQNEGYFGYITVDCYCYNDKYDEKLVVLLQNVRPFFSFVQSYVEWLKFAIGGVYLEHKNQFVADVEIIPETKRIKSPLLMPHKLPKWNETKERCAIIIGQLYHTKFAAYRWDQLKNLFEQCGIVFDAKKKQGCSIILHDNEIRHFGLMMATSPHMATTLSMVHNRLTKLHEILAAKSKRKFESNLPLLIDFFERLSLNYENLAADECPPTIN